MKFRIGDIVRPNKAADLMYIYTNSQYVHLMRVININSENYFTAEVVETTKGNKYLQGRKFPMLEAKAFDIVPNVAEYYRSSTDYEYSRPHSIHITWDGESNAVHGVLKVGSTIKARSCALCHPEDVFEFSTGARIALGRLLGDSDEQIEAALAATHAEYEKDEDERVEEDERHFFREGEKVILKDTLGVEPYLKQPWFYENNVSDYMLTYAYGNASPDRKAVYIISCIIKDKDECEYAIIKENKRDYAPVFVVATSSLLSVEF